MSTVMEMAPPTSSRIWSHPVLEDMLGTDHTKGKLEEPVVTKGAVEGHEQR